MPRGRYQRRSGVVTHAQEMTVQAEQAVEAARPDQLAVENAEGAVDAAEKATDELTRPSSKAFTDHPFGDRLFPGAQSVADAKGAYTVDPKTGRITGRQ